RASTEDTLAALRSAGYAPMSEDESGAVRVERVPRRRAEPKAERAAVPSRPAATSWAASAAGERASRRPPADPGALATSLLSAPTRTVPRQAGSAGAPAPEPASDTAARIARRAPQLSHGEVRLLAHAADHGGPVRIRYIDNRGVPSTRVIEAIELHG